MKITLADFSLDKRIIIEDPGEKEIEQAIDWLKESPEEKKIKESSRGWCTSDIQQALNSMSVFGNIR